MVLNKEMCDLVLNSKKMCTIYDESYVILKKRMPVTDDKLEWYVSSLNNLKNSGVSIAPIVDYTLLPETKKSYNVGSYTEGIFLEERAKGNSLNSNSIYLRVNNDYDFNGVISDYLRMVLEYIEELELRAEASLDVYTKFIKDCNSVAETGLMIDPKPLNFFFDKDLGYTIIDVIEGNDSSLEHYVKYFPQSMFIMVFGYGKPKMYIDFKDVSVLPQDMLERLNKAGRKLEAKIVAALRKFNFSEEAIKEAALKNRFRYESESPVVEIDEMENYIAQEFMKLKSKIKPISKEESDSFIIFA